MDQNSPLGYRTQPPKPTPGELLGLICLNLTWTLLTVSIVITAIGHFERRSGENFDHYLALALICNAAGFLSGLLAIYPGNREYLGIPLILHLVAFISALAFLDR